MEFLVFALLFLIICTLIYLSKTLEQNILKPFQLSEGFEVGENKTDIQGAVDESKGVIQWMDNNQIYDTFYAGVYDQLTQGSVRTQAEIGLMLHEWTKKGEDLRTFQVLDAGCGTGIAVAALAKMNVKKVVGVDKSKSMLDQAKNVVIPQSTLTEEQKGVIDWREGDLIDPSLCAGGEFTHMLMTYFTVYYFADKEAVFRNLFLWAKPGGKLCVQVVNKHKFDPMLESAAPWVGFSLQKYSKERVTKSEVTFDKFKYIGEFDLHDPSAEFRETFRFHDGKVRRQRHTFKMEDINTIVGFAKAAGWTYNGFSDLTKLSAEYFYHLYFTKA
jgi:SAM-dependent methyltransferase